MGISQIHLLAFISVLSLARVQTTTTTVTPQQTTESLTSTTTTTSSSITPQQTSESVTSTTTTTTPSSVFILPVTSQQTSESVTSTTSTTSSSLQWQENFYRFGSEAGDNHSFLADNENFTPVNLSSPFQYFGRQYHLIYVNNNGLLSLSRERPHIDPLHFPYGGEDLIAPFWTGLDVSAYYQEYTSGDVLTRATQDINSYYPGLSFSATWVFVATWDTFADNTYSDLSVPLISVQVVLISDGSRSFILMNYGGIENSFQAKAGYGTIGSTHYFVIPGSNDSNLVQNLKHTSNVHVPGRWAFMAYPENVVGLQIKVTSYLDLTDNGNLAVVLERIKHELVIRGLSSDVQLSARRVKKIP